MNVLNKLDFKLIVENVVNCKSFWVYPVPNNDGFKWEIKLFDGNDLHNWWIVLYIMKNAWKLDFDKCHECYKCLPRGVIDDKTIYFGNNLPSEIKLKDILKLSNSKPGSLKTSINKEFGIDKNQLKILEEILGQELNLQHTDI
jgi:hypothetical protein